MILKHKLFQTKAASEDDIVALMDRIEETLEGVDEEDPTFEHLATAFDMLDGDDFGGAEHELRLAGYPEMAEMAINLEYQ